MNFEILEVIVLSVIFITGAPANFYATVKLWRWKRSSLNRGGRKFSPNFLILQKFLNISDLLIVYVYVSRELLELILKRCWWGGSFLCKLCHVVETFALSLSSNTVACIAIDRAISLAKLKSITRETNVISMRVLISLFVGALCSFAISLPQFLVWDIWKIPPGGESNSTTIYCTTTWIFDYPPTGNSSGFYWMIAYLSTQSLVMSPVQSVTIALCYMFIGIFIYHSVPPTSSLDRQNTEETEMNSFSAVSHTDLTQASSMKTSNRVFLSSKRRRSMASRNFLIFKAATVLVVIYSACWLPYNVAVIWSFVDPASYTEHSRKLKFSFYLIAFNAVLNPFVYKMFNATT